MKRFALLFWIALLPLAAGCSKSEPEQVADRPAAQVEAPAPAEAAKAEAETSPSELAAAVESGEGEVAAEAPASSEIRLAQASPSPLATRFQAGKHYTLINPAQPTSSGPDQVEVAEFFMYTCPHCYSFEPYVQSYLESKPADVNFIRVPVIFNQVAELHARAFFTAEAMGVLEKTHGPMFKEIHINRNMLASEDALVSFFVSQGIDEAEFRKVFNSFIVDTKMRQAATMARRFQISSVPNVVVNGRYTSGGSMTGSYEVLLEVIDELTMIERTR